jgi:hypothetical protein
MDALVYPKERPIIALDYDNTCTTNVSFWQNFCVLAEAAGYDVMIVTARHPQRLQEPTLDFGKIVKRIIATSHQAKLPFCRTLGIDPAIWIEDMPWNIYLNIDGTVPDFPSLSRMHPEFGKDIASYLFPKSAPITVKGYGFFYTECHHEIAPLLKSFHRTKAGAYRAMRKFLMEEWNAHHKMYLEDERTRWLKDTSYPVGPDFPVTAYICISKRHRWSGPFVFSKWYIRPHVMEINE